MHLFALPIYIFLTIFRLHMIQKHSAVSFLFAYSIFISSDFIFKMFYVIIEIIYFFLAVLPQINTLNHSGLSHRLILLFQKIFL